jgi:hypothetical protein
MNRLGHDLRRHFAEFQSYQSIGQAEIPDVFHQSKIAVVGRDGDLFLVAQAGCDILGFVSGTRRFARHFMGCRS